MGANKEDTVKIDYKYDREKRDSLQASKSVQILVHMILGTLLSVAVLSATILAQIVLYFCSLIANLW